MALKKPPSDWTNIFRPHIWYPWFREVWSAIVALQNASPSVINSIQRGTITIAAGSSSNTAAISAVDTSKTMLSYLGLTTTWGTTHRPDRYEVRIDLTNSTTVTARRNSSDAVESVIVSYEVIEFV